MTDPFLSRRSSIEVREVHDWTEIRALADYWSELHSRSRGAHLFNGFTFLDVWQDFYGQEEPVFLLLAEEGSGELCGLMPLQLKRLKRGPFTLRRLGMPHNSYISRSSALIAGEDPMPVARAFAAHLAQISHRYDDLVFENQLRDCPAQVAIRQALRMHGFSVWLEPVERPLRTVIGFTDFEGYLEARPQSIRKDSRRAIKRTDALESFEIRIIDDPGAARDAARRLFSFDWMSHKREKAGAVYPPIDKMFHAELLSRSPNRLKFEYTEVCTVGKPVGASICFVHNRAYYGLLVYTDEQFAAASIGRRLILEAIRRGIQRDDTDFVDLNGESLLLEQLGNDEIHLMTCKATHSGVLSRAVGVSRGLRGHMQRAPRGEEST
jgi:CelD/BcsL family acetyltransferase involved in cellulose biosynthesis